MQFSFTTLIEILGTVAFTISGAFSAMQKRLDLFGVLVIAFITAIGGGTIRDVLIGHTPVSWMQDITLPSVILGTAIFTILFKKYVKNLRVTLFLFYALGLGLFTVIGTQRGLDAGLNPGVCVALGTITGCFGGVLRDVLLNHKPVLFHKEIYATACIAGGFLYILCRSLFAQQFAEAIAVIFICAIRILAVKNNWKLPTV